MIRVDSERKTAAWFAQFFHWQVHRIYTVVLHRARRSAGRRWAYRFAWWPCFGLCRSVWTVCRM